MSAEYTKGPWRVQAKKYVSAGNSFIVQCYARPYDEAEANARLIAAAPELLQSLQLVMEIFEPYAEDWDEDSAGLNVIETARAAIVKATGGAA